MKPIILLQPIVPHFQTSPALLLTPFINSYFPEEDTMKSHENDVQVQYELLE
jgi:hypothetical protein